MMFSEAEMKNALQQYLDGFNQGDAKMIISLLRMTPRLKTQLGVVRSSREKRQSPHSISGVLSS